jgi:type IV secretory pathway TrbF-like protein
MSVNFNALLPSPNDATAFPSGRQQFLELYGSTLVMNSYLKVAVLSLCVISLGLTTLAYSAFERARHVKPLVIRINEFGQAQALPQMKLQYQPREAEIKYFLAQFVQLHFGRMRATVKENFARSIHFLDAPLANQVMIAAKKTQAIESVLSGHTNEIDIEVKSVAIEDLRKAPYRARIEYEKLTIAPGLRQTLKRVRFTTHLVFELKDEVEDAIIPINPLGFTITYFHEDAAFQ